MKGKRFVVPVSVLMMVAALMIVQGGSAEGITGLPCWVDGSCPWRDQFAADRVFQSATYHVGPGVQQSVAVDLNGDGTPDLASVINGSNTVSVQLGRGDGTFKPRSLVRAGMDRPLALTSGDMNGDTRADLVVVNGRRSDHVAVLLGRGNGRFRVQRYPGGHHSQAVVAADLDGDGNLDVVTANGTGGVSRMFGDGNGGLRPAKDLSTRGTMCSSVTAADLNGDGSLDLVAANSLVGYGASDHSIATLMNRGNGRFEAATLYRHVGKQPTMVAVGDLNGDGAADLVTPNGGWPVHKVTIMFGAGDGTFGALHHRFGGPSPHDVEIADLNGDAVPDLAITNLGTSYVTPTNDGVQIRLGKGDGTFGPLLRVSQHWPSSVTAADLNADGRIDLVVPNEWPGNVIVLLNRTP